MIEFTIVLSEKIGNDIGLRFITTDAKRNSDTKRDSLHFYKKLGFEILKQREKGSLSDNGEFSLLILHFQNCPSIIIHYKE
ncbi:hypothetical protein HZA99_02150 [Candidatus Woesearchaeota archaeon]|nr:hypothetical protein [Candidatus Woesearchaeota archaeon]